MSFPALLQTKLWTPFGDILRQSPLAPSSSDETLPAQETLCVTEFSSS